MVSYCLVSPLFTPRVRILRKGRVYTLGRDPGCDFPLPSEVVSRRHAEIEWAPKGGFAIRDLGSKNGTRVNDDRVDWRPLRDGDKLTFGPFSLQYREYQGDISDLLNQTAGDADQTIALSREALQVPTAAGFAGKFGGQELLEICQLIAINEKEGILRVFGEGMSGEIHFCAGEIVRARVGELAGEQAALRLLSLPSGRFDFVGGPVASTDVRLRTAHLIMEAARLRDEQTGAIKDGPAPPSAPGPMQETARRAP